MRYFLIDFSISVFLSGFASISFLIKSLIDFFHSIKEGAASLPMLIKRVVLLVAIGLAESTDF